jgi:hypothetical protein
MVVRELDNKFVWSFAQVSENGIKIESIVIKAKKTDETEIMNFQNREGYGGSHKIQRKVPGREREKRKKKGFVNSSSKS